MQSNPSERKHCTMESIPANEENFKLAPRDSFGFPAALPHARRLVQMGLNVVPMPSRHKSGYAWKPAQFTPLPLATVEAMIAFVARYEGECNLAVMMGQTSGDLSGDLFVIDCETVESFERWRAAFRTARLPLATVRTRRGGHVYARCIDGEIANVTSAGTDGTYEIRGNGCYVLAPGSIHPTPDPDTGEIHHYRWHDADRIPAVTLHTLQHMGLPVTLTGTRGGEKDNPYGLTNETRAFLSGDFVPVEGTRNDTLRDAAMDCAGCGVPLRHAVDSLVDAATASGLTERDAVSTIKSAYSKPRSGAREYKRNGGAPGTQERHIRAWEWADRAYNAPLWDGRTGSTDRAVWGALVSRCMLDANKAGYFRASVREIAEKAEMNKETASKSIRRLMERGFILRSQTADGRSGASRYTFNDKVLRYATHGATAPNIISSEDSQSPDSGILTTQNAPRNVGGCMIRTLDPTGSIVYGLCTPLVHPPDGKSEPSCTPGVLPEGDTSGAAERGALGKTPWRIWQFLLNQDRPIASKRAIADGAGLSADQVKRALRKLRDMAPDDEPMIEHTPDGWIAYARSADWLATHIAVPAGTADKAADRRARHDQERVDRFVLEFFDSVRRFHHARDRQRDGVTITPLPAIALVSTARRVKGGKA